ncbi:MAG: sigma-70 family RNA polymerase sigma factor [Halanaerobiales bacterium]
MENPTYMKELVDGLQQQDTDALEEVMNLYGDKLLRLAIVYMKDYNLAVDIVQQVFIKLYYHIGQFKDQSSLYTWLYRITINECKSKIRSWSFRKLLFTDNLLEKGKTKNIEEDFIKEESKKELFQEILKLKDKYRLVIVLFYYYDFKINEIAEILETNDNTIKTRLFRGRKLLKNFLIKNKEEYYE